MTIPWLWFLLAANVAFGFWGCFGDEKVKKDFFPAGFFFIEGMGAVIWLLICVAESTKLLPPSIQ